MPSDNKLWYIDLKGTFSIIKKLQLEKLRCSMHVILGKTVCEQSCFYTIIKTIHKLCECLDNYQ